MYQENIPVIHNFFDQESLESTEPQDGSSIAWFDQPNKFTTAILALKFLNVAINIRSSGNSNDKQNAIAIGNASILNSVALYIARRGPRELVDLALQFLERLILKNEKLGRKLADYNILFKPCIPEKSVPSTYGVMPTVIFSWKPLPTGDSRFFTIPSLLVERYLYPFDTWTSPDIYESVVAAAAVPPDAVNLPSLADGEDFINSDTADGFSRGCLRAFETWLGSDANQSSFIIQHILAPPLPSSDDDARGSTTQLESPKPFGSTVLTILTEGCYKVFLSSANLKSIKPELDTLERCINIFTLVFVNGTALSREMSTAITTNHALQSSLIKSNIQNQLLLPFLMSVGGRAARLSGGLGYPVLDAILRMLTAAMNGCPDVVRAVIHSIFLATFHLYCFHVSFCKIRLTYMLSTLLV
jgi:hypothetical protein